MMKYNYEMNKKSDIKSLQQRSIEDVGKKIL